MKKHETISATGELALIRRLTRALPLRGGVLVGPGDDCAVVKGAASGRYDYLLTSDASVEGAHFTPQTAGMLVGRKALGRALSDIAAMGGEPLWVLVDLTAPATVSIKRIERIYAGLRKMARQFKVSIVGGDVSSGSDLQLHVFAAGRAAKKRAILRSGAKAGEALFVTGALGGSFAGKHLAFQPRLREGRWLAAGKWATAMIDISDGLLRDLGHIMRASGIGVLLKLEAIPISPAARRRLAGRRRALGRALTDGEDYELLFTVPEKKKDAFRRAWRRKFRLACVQIGRTTRRAGLLEGLDAAGKRIQLQENGFEHFVGQRAPENPGQTTRSGKRGLRG